MGVPLYYFPRETPAAMTRERLRDSPLADPYRDCLVGPVEFERSVSIREVHANGPDQGNGVIVAALGKHSPQQRVGVYKGIEWHSWNQGQYWIGLDPLHPVTVDDLARSALIPGYDVRLGEQTWHVPTVRRGAKFPTLPQTVGFNADGLFEMRLRREWEPIWEQSGKIYDQFFQPGSYPFPQIATLCANMLGINYRVGPAESFLLELVDTENWSHIYEAVLDWPLVKEMLDDTSADPNAAAPAPAGEAGEPPSSAGSAA
jgi:hypothetical protein